MKRTQTRIMYAIAIFSRFKTLLHFRCLIYRECYLVLVYEPISFSVARTSQNLGEGFSTELEPKNHGI